MSEEAKHKRLIRVFFNTFYEDAASKAIETLRSFGMVRSVVRSSIVPELYYVELDPHDKSNLRELASKIEEALRKDDRVFGVKAYPVTT